MNLKNKIRILFIFFLFLVFPKPCFASTKLFVTIVNPIRGIETWGSNPESPLDLAKLEKQKVDKQTLPATWLLRSDVVSSKETAEYFKSFSNFHELGIFFEIMPNLAREASINYPQKGIFWHDANKIFLSGYKPEDRIKLIDRTFENFKSVFGYYPKSVGAWHIDAFSADYMEKKYGVTGVLICADQYGTDRYQIWGGWWGVPFYPSKLNILTPAQTLKNKLDLVIFWWAARDPVLGYGGTVDESTYSVQVNDYISHGLGSEYFKKLLDIYLDKKNLFGQVTIGLENDNDWQKISSGFDLQLDEVKQRKEKNEIEVLTMRDFSDWYINKFPKLSPSQKIDGWEMSIEKRVSTITKDDKNFLRDLRIYNEKWPEPNLLSANPWESLSLNYPSKIDAVRNQGTELKFKDQKDLERIIKNFGFQKIPFKMSDSVFYLYYLLLICILCFFFRKNVPLFLLIILGSVCLSLVMVKSGLVYSFGMGFWGPNGHDGIWHISLINQLSKFSLEHPTFSGNILTNYHFGFDLLTAILFRLTGIMPVNLYFQILPPVLAVLLGILCYSFVNKWTGSNKSALWSTFFVYFGGSLGWLVNYLRNGNFGGESMFWANQSISTLINPPYALSLIILLAGLIKLLDYFKKPDKKNLIVCSLLLGILMQIKVYIGIIVLLSLACMLPVALLFRRDKIKEILRLFLGTLSVALIVFLPFNLKASSLLVFNPLWFSRTMLAYSDRLGWIKLENARIAYFYSGKWIKWVLAEGLALTIFIFGNIGTRVIGLLYGGFILKKKQQISEIEIFIYSALIFSLIIPLLFIQKGNPWNTIQFFYYFQFVLAIMAGLTIGKLPFNFILTLLIIFLTIPTTINSLRNDYLPWRPPSRISIEELEALNFLRTKPRGVVLSYPFMEEWRSNFSEPRPLYAYETTAYVSALSGKITYLEDEMNLEISGYNWQPRRDNALRFFSTDNRQWAVNFLQENKIKYMYLVKGQKMNLGQNDINCRLIFENGEVKIYQIQS